VFEFNTTNGNISNVIYNNAHLAHFHGAGLGPPDPVVYQFGCLNGRCHPADSHNEGDGTVLRANVQVRFDSTWNPNGVFNYDANPANITCTQLYCHSNGLVENGENPGDDGTLQGDVPIQWDLSIGRLNPVMEKAPDQYCVSGVQQRLNNLALNCGPVDGIRGPNTRASIEAFQRIFGLTPDAIPGQGETQPKLVDVHDKPDSIVGPAPAPSGDSGS